MRVALDYTPAISQQAGVGRYTRSLFNALISVAPSDTEWTLWYPKNEPGAEGAIPTIDSVRGLQLNLTARWSNLMWHRIGLPVNLERFAGSVSVVHGTDFVVPPSNAPSVVTIHDLSYALLPDVAFPRLRRYLERAVPRSINRANRVIAVSETTKQDICRIYEIAPHRVEVIHHAADPLFHRPSEAEVFRVIAQFGLRRPYFISVGTIEPRKDHKTLLRAFERVHAERPETSLVIVGRRGWLSDDIMADIEETSRRIPVFHLQGVRDDVLPALYGGSAAMVYPSKYEGFGLPLLEAMQSGTPVIASDTPALREVGDDAAAFAAPGDIDAFARQMVRILSDDAHRRALVDHGRDRAMQFTWESAARRHFELYLDVASG